MTPMTSPGCRTIRAWLTAAHDDELSVRRRVLLDAHLTTCARCCGVRDDLTSLAPRSARAQHSADLTRPLSRVWRPRGHGPAGDGTRHPWRHRVHDAIDDRQRLWMIGGTLAATLAGALVVAAFAGLAAPTHPGSLASLMSASTALGSNANPL